MIRPRGGSAGVALAMAGLVTVSGCKNELGEASAPVTTPAGTGAALSVVDSLTVKGRAPKTGYERDNFGSAWADTDSNRCDTRVISMLRQVIEAFAQLTQGVVSCAY